MPFRWPCALLFVCLAPLAHAQFTDDFSDGDFTAAPAWSGNATLFAVADDAGNLRLRSNSPGAANYYLSTPSTLADEAQWEWSMDLRFGTSGANYVDVYLMSDAADLSTGANGYFLRCGGTADRLELFRSESGAGFSTGLVSADGIINSSSSNPFRIKVTRSAAGVFTLFLDDGQTGTYVNAGTVTDLTHTATAHFGLRIEQSSAAGPVNNHWFDDFLVQPIPVDNTPPTVEQVVAVSADQVDVLFSEALDPATAEVPGNYDIQPFNSASAAVLDGSNPALVHLTLAIALTSGNTYQLFVYNVEDLAGNAITANGPFEFSFVVPDTPEPGDVVINEIMADPTPVVQLPDAEFIELVNATTDKFLDLAGWQLSTLSTQTTLPTYVLGPGQHVVFVNNAQLPNFTGCANCLGWSLGNTALLNAGTTLTLTAPGSLTIDAVSYTDDWYGDDAKDDGGWTLERINPGAPCSNAGNWTASNDPSGGTPGTQNSVFDDTPDTTPPLLTAVQVLSPTQVVLVFNEPLDAGAASTALITIDPAIAIDNTVLQAPANDRLLLTLSGPMTEGVFHTVTVESIADCSGNTMAPASGSFALPEAIEAGDLVINEVLYDPVGNGSDFVELYNRSTKVLSLGGLQLANESDGMIGSYRLITADPTVLVPGAYILLATNISDIATRYPQGHTDRFLQMSLPSFNNGEGTVVLAGADSAVLDLFRYDDDLHFELLNTTEGTSLERVDPDRATDDPTNWHSAAQDIGKATPGYRNSQYAPAPEPSGEIGIDPAIFSPDNDGHQDLLTITYRFNEPGFVATLKVYDVAGREVRTLWNNELLGTAGAVSWDGIMDGGSKARMGPYVVLLEAYDLSGNVEKFRKTVTLAHRLD